jgi:hypothetical protein
MRRWCAAMVVGVLITLPIPVRAGAQTGNIRICRGAPSSRSYDRLFITIPKGAEFIQMAYDAHGMPDTAHIINVTVGITAPVRLAPGPACAEVVAVVIDNPFHRRLRKGMILRPNGWVSGPALTIVAVTDFS